MYEKTSPFPIIDKRYQILSTLANGGMSVIYRAKDLTLGRVVAIKVLKSSLSENKVFQEMFRKEARSSANLTHPNIVTIYDSGVDGKRFFIVMELIGGSDLKEIILKQKLMRLGDGIKLIIQASSGLAFAHDHGIVHCDIKPQNMLVSSDGILKITDFGISRALDKISRTEKHEEVWGSPFYISPEIAKGAAPTPASDVYSLGVIMYEMFTGVLPYKGDDALSIINKHQTEELVPPKQKNPEIPDQLNKVIIKALRKSPEKRYESGKKIYDALLSFSNHLGEPIIQNEKQYVDSKLENEEIIEKISPMSEQNKYDWWTILLSLLAIITIGGLIPFWLFIYLSINR